MEPPDRARFDVFLSYNSEDREAVHYVAEKLRLAGLNPWIDAARLSPGGAFQDELAAGIDASGACAVFIGQATGGLRWSRTESQRALNRYSADPNFRVFPVLLPGIPLGATDYLSRLPPFLKDISTVVDLRPGLDHEASFRTLILAVKGLPYDADRPEAAAVVPDSPYRGLFPFGEDEAEQFFGRASDLHDLLDRVARSGEAGGARFLGLIGPSGSGKSSLMRAGLMSAIRDGALPGSQQWQRRILRPKTSPLLELATALQPDPASADPAAVLAYVDALRSRPNALDVAARSRLHERSPQARFVVAIDQFEEVFTLCADPAEREAFVTALTHAATVDGGPTIIMVTMRSDFIDQGARQPGLADLLNQNVYFVPPLSEAGLREAVERPASARHVRFEPGLVDTIVHDVMGQPGALPLLQFALRALWERDASSGVLTLDGYVQTGGVNQSIARQADALYASLPPDQQALARRALLRLTEPGPGTDHTRRRVGLDELEELATVPAEQAAVRDMLRTLVDARLITTDRDAVTNQARVEVSHEALIRNWGTLKAWIEAERETLVRVGRLRDTALEWERLGHDEELLFQGARLADAREHRAALEPHLSEAERHFLDASIALSRREQAARDRARRRTMIVSLLVAAVALVLSSASFYQWRRAEDALVDSQTQTTAAVEARKTAVTAQQTSDWQRDLAFAAQSTAVTSQEESARQRDVANAQRQTASSRSLAATALTLLDRQTDLALLLAEQALHLSDTFEARNALLTTIRQRPTFAGVFSLPGRQILTAAVSPDGSLVATAADRSIVVWDVATRQPLGARFTGHTESIVGVTFSADGAMLASYDSGGTILTWNARDGSQLRPPIEADAFGVKGVAFSGDGQRLRAITVAGAAEGGARKVIRSWAMNESAPSREFVLDELPASRIVPQTAEAISPDGGYVAVARANGDVRVWSIDDDHLVGRLIGSTTGPVSLTFSPDNTRIAAVDIPTATQLARLQIFPIPNTAQGAAPRELSDPDNPGSRITSPEFRLAFSGDGTRLYVRSRTELFEANGTTGKIVRRLVSAADEDITVSLATNKDASLVAVLVGDQAVLVRPAQDLLVSAADLLDVGDEYGTFYSGDGRYLIGLAGDGGTVVLFDANSHQEVRRQQIAKGTTMFAAVASRLAWSDRIRFVARNYDPRDDAPPLLLHDLVLSSGEVTQRGTLPLQHTSAWGMSITPDGRFSASRRTSGEIDVVRLDDLAIVQTIQASPARQTNAQVESFDGAAISPDARLVAAREDDVLTVWDVTSASIVAQFPNYSVADPSAPNDQVSHVLFDQSGTRLAVGWILSRLELRDLSDPQRIGRAIQGQDRTRSFGGIGNLQFSPDGTILAAGGTRGVQLWDADTAQPLGLRFTTPQPEAGPFEFRPAWSPDGHTLVISGGMPSAHVVNMDPAAWRHAACSMAGRDLTDDEWRQYLPDQTERRACGQ